jgi:hypothetical protein
MSDSSTTSDSENSRAEAVEDLRRQVARRDRRRGRIAVWSAFGGVMIIAAGLFGYGFWVTHNKPSYVVPKHVALHTDGIIAGGSGPIRVDVYVNYQCTTCRLFEASTAAVLNQAIAANKITLIYHPLAPTGATAASQNSIHAAASAACASDMGFFLAYSNLLFIDEPLAAIATPTTPVAPAAPPVAPKAVPTKPAAKSHGKAATKVAKPPVVVAKPAPVAVSAGLTDDQLVQVGGAAGIINPQFAQCLRAGTYDKWVASENSLAAKDRITAPTVLVNGASIAAAGAAPTLAELKAALS